MLLATVVGPDEQDHHECQLCDLDYSPEHYEILLSSKKLAYFRLEDSRMTHPFPDWTDVPISSICHGCLFEVLRSLSGKKKKVIIKVIYKDAEYKMSFDPSEASGSSFF